MTKEDDDRFYFALHTNNWKNTDLYVYLKKKKKTQ